MLISHTTIVLTRCILIAWQWERKSIQKRLETFLHTLRVHQRDRLPDSPANTYLFIQPFIEVNTTLNKNAFKIQMDYRDAIWVFQSAKIKDTLKNLCFFWKDRIYISLQNSNLYQLFSIQRPYLYNVLIPSFFQPKFFALAISLGSESIEDYRVLFRIHQCL